MMIVSIFLLFNYILSLVKIKIAKKEIDDNDEQQCSDTKTISLHDFVFEGEAVITEGNVQFFPPAYLQRYRAVIDVINFYKKIGSIKKIVDFGCAELSFFTFIKHLEGVEEFIGVDINGSLLKRTCCRTTPLTADYLSKRCSPLKIFVLKGSVIDPDIRLKNANVVVAIELIEHMYPNEVNCLPYNIFGVIQPELVIFTTPNSDFNVLFPNFTGFRHPDHKFEWSRIEFQDWGKNVTAQYPSYDVSFYGIGKGPPGTEMLGCCSQMAVFVRNTTQVLTSNEKFSEIHECICEVDYPFQTLEEKLNCILEYEIYQFINRISRTEEYVVGEKREVPIHILLKIIGVDCPFDKLVEFLITTQNEVKYINNQATLILPYNSSDDDISTNLSEDDENNSVIENEDNLAFERDTESWDVDVESDKMNADVNKPNWDSLENTICRKDLNSPEAIGSLNHSSGCVPPSVSNNELDTRIEEIINSCPKDIAEKTTIISLKDDKRTGAIPKQKIILSESLCSSTSVSSSEETENLGLVRCAGSVDIHGKPLVFPVNHTYENEDGPQDIFIEHVTTFSPGKSPCKYLSTDVITMHGFEQISTNPGENSVLDSPKATGKSDKLCGKVYKCMHCSQTYLNKHVCLRRSKNEHILEIKASCEENMIDVGSAGSEVLEQASSSSVHRSRSLGNVKAKNGECKNFRYSLNIDNDLLGCDTSVVDMELEDCCKVSSVPSLTDTFGSFSKAADSGYPNSVHDMDLDLTPEQVDEIITETESSLDDEDSSGEEHINQVPANAALVFLDEVENGDVANNNRDGEGNNMEGREMAEVFNFEGLVMEAPDPVVEADQHESDDEGLYLSALDVSNETLVPEETSHDESLFNSVFDGHSSSHTFRIEDLNALSLPAEEVNDQEFPPWLLNILISEFQHHVDSGISIEPGVIQNETEESSLIVVNDVQGQIEVTVPVDVFGGGDSKFNT